MEQLVHILWLQLCFFLLFNHAFDSLQATEEDHRVLEPLEVVELFEVDDLPLVRCSETAVIASLIWTLIEDSLQAIGHTHVIAPVDALLEEGLVLADHLAGVEFDVLIEIWLVKFHCYSSALLETDVDLTVLVNANVDPRSLVRLARPVDDNSFSVGSPLVCSQVMWGIERVH